MVCKELGLAKVTLARAEHALNALSLIFVTEFGISILVNEVQATNAYNPMLFNELGLAKVTLARREHALNALSPMLVTEFGILTLVI